MLGVIYQLRKALPACFALEEPMLVILSLCHLQVEGTISRICHVVTAVADVFMRPFLSANADTNICMGRGHTPALA